MTSHHTDRRLSIYYDGDCPLCSKEINFYKTFKGADAIRWVDLCKAPRSFIDTNLDRDAALERFHVRSPDGILHSGGAAFAHMWSVLPALAVPGRWMRLWPFSVLLEAAYRTFLLMRRGFQKLARTIA